MADLARNFASSAAGYGHAGVQRVLGRDRTADVGRWIAALYRDQPLLLGLVLTWAAFVAAPLAAFAAYAALWAAIAFGVFWAIFLFWAGLGLLVFLVPAVCVATGLALVTFAWAAVAYYLVGAWVLGFLGYESLDAALGVSGSGSAPLTTKAPLAATTTPTTKPVPPPHHASLSAGLGNDGAVGIKRQQPVKAPVDNPFISKVNSGPDV